MDEIEARQDAIKYIGLRLVSSGQVRDKLLKKGYDENIVDNVIDQLIEMEYIDDLKYARNHIKNRNLLNPKSSRMLEMELSKKGISSDIIDKAIGESDIDDFNTALELAKKRFKNFQRNDENLKKLYTYLSYRGFDSETIMRISDML